MVLGIGGSVNIFNDYVPTYSRNHTGIQKKIDDAPDPVKTEQIGAGEHPFDEISNDNVEKKLDPNIFKSFQHPRFVVTEKVQINKRKSKEVSWYKTFSAITWLSLYA